MNPSSLYILSVTSLPILIILNRNSKHPNQKPVPRIEAVAPMSTANCQLID